MYKSTQFWKRCDRLLIKLLRMPYESFVFELLNFERPLIRLHTYDIRTLLDIKKHF